MNNLSITTQTMTISRDLTCLEPFSPTFTSCVIFFEADQHLVLGNVNQDSPAGCWGLPGGKLNNREEPKDAVQRIFSAQLEFRPSVTRIEISDCYHMRHRNEDSKLYFCRINESGLPVALQNKKKISIFALRTLAQDNLDACQVLDAVYSDRVWRRVEKSSQPDIQALTLRKGAQQLVFHRDRPFIVPMIGTDAEMNETIAKKLGFIFGLTKISPVELFKNETINSNVKKMFGAVNSANRDEPAPDELTSGMLVKRLSNDDCSPGYIMQEFPTTATQCRIFFNQFVRSSDFVLPINLTTDPDAAEDEVLTAFNNQTRLGEIIQIDASEENATLHKVLQIIESRLNNLAKDPNALLQPLNTAHSSQSSEKKWAGGAVLTVAVIAGLVGGFFIGETVKRT